MHHLNPQTEAYLLQNGDTLELDIPFRELSFEGVPFRTSARLQPTTECLVHLTDPPFLVVTLSEIEIASLERVQYGLKQFDLVFIFKDFTKAPLHINSIQSAQMDDVKNWLEYVTSFIRSTNDFVISSFCISSVDIPMSEGPVNLNWGPIMKHINESPFEFFQQGGWSFLGGAGGVEVCLHVLHSYTLLNTFSFLTERALRRFRLGICLRSRLRRTRRKF